MAFKKQLPTVKGFFFFSFKLTPRLQSSCQARRGSDHFPGPESLGAVFSLRGAPRSLDACPAANAPEAGAARDAPGTLTARRLGRGPGLHRRTGAGRGISVEFNQMHLSGKLKLSF